MTRRVLLRLLAILAVWHRGAGHGSAADEPSAARLSAEDVDDLIAFVGVLVEGRALNPTERDDVLAHVQDRLERQEGSRDLYRTTVRLLERLGGRRFSLLDVPARLELVTRHRLGIADVRPSESLGAFADDLRAVRTGVVRDLIGGYYASPSGWAVVGYTAFPGRCGDLTRYTRAER